MTFPLGCRNPPVAGDYISLPPQEKCEGKIDLRLNERVKDIRSITIRTVIYQSLSKDIAMLYQNEKSYSANHPLRYFNDGYVKHSHSNIKHSLQCITHLYD